MNQVPNFRVVARIGRDLYAAQNNKASDSGSVPKVQASASPSLFDMADDKIDQTAAESDRTSQGDN
jgi:hypothetical protein